MSKQQLVERILSDAQAEAQEIIKNAEDKAAKLLADASLCAEKALRETEQEVGLKRESILERKAATARLDGAKLLLSEKRKVIDAIYEKALLAMQKLEKEDALRLVSTLLEKYAEKGDEIYFAENFSYQKEAVILPVIAQKQLRIAQETVSIDGGLILKGKKSDKDLSYGALLAADREVNQAELARKIFK